MVPVGGTDGVVWVVMRIASDRGTRRVPGSQSTARARGQTVPAQGCTSRVCLGCSGRRSVVLAPPDEQRRRPGHRAAAGRPLAAGAAPSCPCAPIHRCPAGPRAVRPTCRSPCHPERISVTTSTLPPAGPSAPRTPAATSAPADADRLPLLPLLLLAAMGFILVATETMPAGLLPEIAEGLGTSEGAAGQLVSAYALGTVLMTVPAVACTRGLRRKPSCSRPDGLLVANAVTALVSTSHAAS